ncbi:MAG TPA: hypothetical protein VGI85_06710 [Chthoniobacterales bacterium]
MSPTLAVIFWGLLLSLAPVAFAQTIWTAQSGDWFQPASWSNGIPNLSSVAEINDGGAPQIDAGAAATKNLFLGFNAPDSGELLISGSGNLQNGNLLAVGYAGRGTMTASSGGAISDVFGHAGYLAGSCGVVTVDGAGTSWKTELYLYIGFSGTGGLTIRNGAAVSQRLAFVGNNAGSSGTVVVDGVGSTWTGIGQIQIGSDGSGELTIRNRGAVADLVGYVGCSGTGTVLVDGQGSKWSNGDRLMVGDGGRGVLTIQNGAIVSNTEGFIGRLAGGEGEVIVDGAGSTWTNSVSLEIGESGTGTLMIVNGGAVASGDGLIAAGPRSRGNVTVDGHGSIWTSTLGINVYDTLTIQNRGTVVSDIAFVDGTAVLDGAGSTWTTGKVSVATSSSGSLTIRNGAVLSSADLAYIGSTGASTGTVVVDGTGSKWDNDFEQIQLYVGFYHAGTLDITNGGVVSTFALGVGAGLGSNGRLTVDGARTALDVRTNLYVGGGDFGAGPEPGGTGLVQIAHEGAVSSTTTTVFGQGTLVDDGVLKSRTLTIMPGGSLSGEGTISGNVGNAGQVEPGDSIGALAINGNYTQDSGGTLVLEISSSEAQDHLSIAGNALLDGTVEVRFVNGALPTRGQVFELLDVSGAVAGSFARVIFPDLRSGFQFSAQFVNGRYRITALSDGAPAAGFLNISTRGEVGSGDDALIAGFIITGTAEKKVIIRGLGPSLAVGGTPVPGRLNDPSLELRGNTGELISSNDNWADSSQRQEIIDSTIPPGDPHEAAIVATLAPGNYTAILRSVGNGAGIGVVEVYNLSSKPNADLANISTRGFVATGDEAMIGGFIVDDQDTPILLRALGPSLRQARVSDALADPTLELHNSNGDVIAFNNDWRETDEAIIQNTGIPPPSDKESAIIATLGPGHFTAILRGQNSGVGVALLEVYDLR